ncbi:MAG: hypothetical protein PHX18_04660 [Candidatus Gastranaerophilales bacterium]|nr:hypothetical protein [Candidatus Gastranaerophilales bacterium]
MSDRFKKLTDKLNPAKHYNNEIYRKTKHYQKKYGFEIGKNSKNDTWNNEADAFKHAFASADLALKLTQAGSKIIGDKHEKENLQAQSSYNESNMDWWNNQAGRDIAKEIRQEYNFLEVLRLQATGKMDDIIAEKVMQRMRKCDLITNPNDKRDFRKNYNRLQNTNLTGFAAPVDDINRVYTLEEIKNMPKEEFLQNRQRILEDFANKKILSEENAKKEVQSGNLVWVNSYTRADGTKVRGYYRSK